MCYKVALAYPRHAADTHEERLKALEQSLSVPETCQIIREQNCIQITKKGAGKLEGILQICQKRGYEKKQIAVFGNAEADIPMLRYFPFSVAVKGSSERVKKNAAIVLE